MREQVWQLGAGGFYGEILLAPAEADELRLKRDRPLLAVRRFYVHPLRRGQGWGAALFSRATSWADAKGVDLVLYVKPYGRIRKVPAETLERIYAQYGFRRLPYNGGDREMIRRAAQ